LTNWHKKLSIEHAIESCAKWEKKEHNIMIFPSQPTSIAIWAKAKEITLQIIFTSFRIWNTRILHFLRTGGMVACSSIYSDYMTHFFFQFLYTRELALLYSRHLWGLEFRKLYFVLCSTSFFASPPSSFQLVFWQK
jgi:hypothetical protein